MDISEIVGAVRNRLDVLEQTATANEDFGMRHKNRLTEYGKQTASEIVKLAPDPVLLTGPAGFGKSALARHVSNLRGGEMTSINFDTGMRLEPLIGTWLPEPVDAGISIKFWDGVLTKAIETGQIFLGEELSRAPQELLSRIFGPLDTDFRSWNVIEQGAGGERVVHADFWFIGTMNPAASGYSGARQLDKALMDRMAGVWDISQPIADEPAILRDYVDGYVADAIMRFVEDARSNKDTVLSTRNIVQIARAHVAGYPLERAVAIAVSPKFNGHGDGLNRLADQHLKNLKPPTPAPVTPTVTPVPVPVTPTATPTVTATVTATATPAPAKTRRNAWLNGCTVKHRPVAAGNKAELENFAQYIQTNMGNVLGYYGWICNCGTCLPLRGGYVMKLRPASPARVSRGHQHPARDVQLVVKNSSGVETGRSTGKANITSLVDAYVEMVIRNT